MTVAALSYHAHDGCPPAVVFVEQVRARTPNVEFGDAHGKPTVDVSVEITRSREQSIGKLTIVSPVAPPTERELSGATCSELVRALALSAAMNLDPSLTETMEPVAEPSSETHAPSNPIVPPGRATPPETSIPMETRRPRVPDPERPSATSIGANVGADFFFGQATAPGITLFVDHVYEGRTQPSWRVGLHGSRAVVSGEQGQIELYWITTRLTGSPIRFRLGDLDLVPGAMVEGGAFVGHGSPVALQSKSDATTWLALGLGARFELRLSPTWVAQVDADALLPLWRREAGFRDPVPGPNFETPAVTASAAAGVRYVFP